MWAKLARYTFPDRPDWTLIHEDVPLGKLYQLSGSPRKGMVTNLETGESRVVECYYGIDLAGHAGYVIQDVLEMIPNLENN